jgi:hypothetical protein
MTLRFRLYQKLKISTEAHLLGFFISVLGVSSLSTQVEASPPRPQPSPGVIQIYQLKQGSDFSSLAPHPQDYQSLAKTRKQDGKIDPPLIESLLQEANLTETLSQWHPADRHLLWVSAISLKKEQFLKKYSNLNSQKLEAFFNLANP